MAKNESKMEKVLRENKGVTETELLQSVRDARCGTQCPEQGRGKSCPAKLSRQKQTWRPLFSVTMTVVGIVLFGDIPR